MNTPNIERLITGWSDQKLAEVFAFNQDGRMGYYHPCGCLVGVHSTEGALHNKACGVGHYTYAKNDATDRNLVEAAETEYWAMGRVLGEPGLCQRDELRQRGLDTIFRAEMERRERAKLTAAAIIEEALVR